MPLSPDKVQALYANRRQKGFYAICLNEQRESDENGFAAKETYPRLKDKSNATIVQGFKNAAEKLELLDVVDVISDGDEDVFVIFTDRVEYAEAA
jgi:hypothetical protein